MSITLELLKTHDPNNKIVKSTSGVATLTGVLKDDTSVLNPTIRIDTKNVSFATGTNIFTPNYASIPDFGRYYHIKDIVQINNTIFDVSMHVDVLMSWSSGLLAAPCIVARNQDNFNLYLYDPNYKTFQNDHVLITKATGGFPIENSCFAVTIFGDKEYYGS